MNIFDHLLPDAAILGIGPLMYEQHMDMTAVSLYGTCRYWFHIHLAAHTTAIKSNWFNPRESNGELHKIEAYKEEYCRIRERVAELIGETTDERKRHLALINTTSASLKEHIELLVTNLHPDIKLLKPITARIARLKTDADLLTELAFK